MSDLTKRRGKTTNNIQTEKSALCKAGEGIVGTFGVESNKTKDQNKERERKRDCSQACEGREMGGERERGEKGERQRIEEPGERKRGR
jgi:hypothetical protein